MPLPADDRDAMTRMADDYLEHVETAYLFAMFLARGFVPGISGEEIKTLAKRFADARVPAVRYWKEKCISGPQQEAQEARQ